MIYGTEEKLFKRLELENEELIKMDNTALIEYLSNIQLGRISEYKLEGLRNRFNNIGDDTFLKMATEINKVVDEFYKSSDINTKILLLNKFKTEMLAFRISEQKERDYLANN